jgi:SNF2 family DNA or RNA helicase
MKHFGMKSLAQLRRSAYQLVALSKLLCNRRNAILICDGVGVGKTISAAFIITYLISKLRRPALVVSPASLVDKWYLELRSKFQLDAVPIRSGEELNLTIDYWDAPNDRPRVYVLSSSLLSGAEGIQFSGPIVFDEIHNYRNPTTQLWSAAKLLAASASHRVGLSATPINNGISDLAAEFSILLNLNLHVSQAIIQDVWRPGRQDSLYPLMTRFAKDRLGIHFAKREVHDVHIPVPESYRDEVISAVKSLRNRPKSDSIYRDEITYFRLAASSGRAFSKSTGIGVDDESRKRKKLESILNVHAKEPVIIFCEFEETAKELEDVICSRDRFVITGSVPVFAREDILNQFRKAGNAALIMTSVGAEGIDLQFCSTLINHDLNWNPMVLEQRIGRIDRIGQEKSIIRIYNLVIEGSIDERIVETLGRKLGLVEGSVLEPATVLGGAGPFERPLFTSTTLEKELKQAQLLARAIELSSSIIPEDYELLPAIDPSFCSPDKIREASSTSELEWLVHSEELENWQLKMGKRRVKLDELIKSYGD